MTTSATNEGAPGIAVILAAGEGTRLRPLTSNRPKPMLPVATRPVLEYVLDAVVSADIEEIHLVVGYGGDRVQSYFGSSYRDVPVEYHKQQSQLGSGHALLTVRDAIDAPFLVLNGDQIVDSTMVEEVRNAHEGSATMAVVEADRAPQYGVVRLSGGEVVEFIEQPGTGFYRLLNAGVYAFGPNIFDVLQELEFCEGELLLSDVISEYVTSDRRVAAVRSDRFWRDATYPWDLLTLSREMLSRGEVSVPKIRSRVFVAHSAQIHENATLVGPVVVDDEAVVEAGAVVGPNVAISAGAAVGPGTVVRNSIIGEGTRLGANAGATDLVTGEAVRIEQGATVMGGPADVRLGPSVHENVDLGAVFADRAQLGGGGITKGGTLVGPDARIGIGAIVDGVVAENTEVVR